MKAISRPLVDFIKDYHLVNPEDVVSFKAAIQFNINGYRGELTSEVQIVTIKEKNIDVVYLMNPETINNHLPDTYPGDNVVFSYVNNQCLVIKGTHPQEGEYIVSLFPLN